MGKLPQPPACPAFRRKHGIGPYVIAEIGVNHEGNLDLAKRLIDEAVQGGADCVKFQTYKASKLASKNSPSYWDLKSEPTTSQHELFSRFDKFGDSEYLALADHANKVGVDFASTPFDLEAVELLAPLMPFFKIASADLTNIPLLEACAAHKKPMLLSTGASHLSEIEEAVRRLRTMQPPENICVMHCVLNYPTPYERAHLAAIRHLSSTFFEHPIGYSDHTRPDPSMLVLCRAYELGAVVLEKHFTHDKTLPGNDHYHAMNEADLRTFRNNIELLHSIEGEERKHVLPEEEISRKNARRSLVAARDLPAGHVLSAGDLVVKRPAFGLPTSALEWVVGKQLQKALKEDDFLTLDHLIG
jgi:N-acetylneuraminate synthase